MAVYVLCRNARIKSHYIYHIMYMHCYAFLYLSIARLSFVHPTCFYLMGETPLVNCGPRSYSLHSIHSTCFTVFFANIFHSIRLILCYSKPVRLTTSLFRWGKVLWLCCAGS